MPLDAVAARRLTPSGAPTAALLLAVLAALAACTTAGSTFRSGVGDSFLEHPPYYAGRAAGDTAAVVHLPVAYQRGASQEAMFDPVANAGTATARLLAEMNAFLDSLGVTRAAGAAVAGVAPDVQFGCVADASGDCATDLDPASAAGEIGRPRQRLAVARPSAEWVAATRQALDVAGAGRALVLTLEIGQYMPRQKNLRGSKEVELGTGYSVPLPWLTSLETQIGVLQLTGRPLPAAP